MDEQVRRYADCIPERFDLATNIGEGGFGAVYRARDEQRDADVALKVLHDFDPENLYRFKREFRALEGITHPNLVTLYELFSSDDLWFFTMELVDGENLVADLTDGEIQRRGRASESGDRSRRVDLESSTSRPTAAESPVAETRTVEREVESGQRTDQGARFPSQRDDMPPLHPDRLRRRLRDLAGALDTLHGAGKLHRDLKPSNVLVEEDRVVVLDFGMVADLFGHREAESLDGSDDVFVGTPRYAAPEQVTGARVTPASDWYAVGVMVYQALTGFLPVDGESTRDILEAKSHFRPVDVREFRGDVPEDLAELTMDLLAERPAERPDASEVAHRLGSESSPSLQESPTWDEEPSTPFVGRREERDACHEAVRRATAEGSSHMLRILGDSGIGKTALVEEVLRELAADANSPPVLRGRCYENESVPYKALDELVDELSRRLENGDAATEVALDPDQRLALAQVFPVLASLRDGESGRTDDSFAAETEHRDAAITGFNRLLELLAPAGRVVLFIDDVQWGDRDSAEFLARTLAEDAGPACAFLVTCRSDDVETSDFLTTFDEETRQLDLDLSRDAIELSPLEDRHGRELAEQLMTRDGSSPVAPEIDHVVEETGGSPYFIGELARYVRHHDDEPGEVDHLDDVLTHRMGRLDEPVRRLLEVVAVAGRPVERDVARRVAGLEETGPEAVADLRARRMIRVRDTEAGERLESYHDRLRETLQATVDEERRRHIHAALAKRLEHRDVDPERLSDHHERAGNPEIASGFAVEAAEEAIDALAYDRAVRMLQRAEQLGTWDPDERSALAWHRGRILERLARCRRAAAAFLEASRHRDGIPALRARIRSSEQLMSAGRPREALDRLYEVVDALELDLPRRERASSLPRLAWKRWSVARRDFDYEVQDPASIPNGRRVRLRALSVIGGVLATMDMKGSAYYQMEYLERAADAGDPTHIGSALTMHALREGSVETDDDWPLDLVDEAESMIDATDQPGRIRVICGLVRGVLLYSRGDWHASDEAFREVIDNYDPLDSGSMWEFQTLRFYSLMPLFWLGDFERYRHVLPDLLEEALERENRLLETAARSWGYLARLTQDRPERAIEGLDRAEEGWGPEGYQLPDFWQMLGRGETAVYTDDVSRVWPLLRDHWLPLHTSLLMQVEIIHVLMHHLRARLAILAAYDTPGFRRTAWKAVAHRSARCIESTGETYREGMAEMIRGELRALDGDVADAIDRYRRAETRLGDTDTAFYEIAARRRIGELKGGSEGRQLVGEADEWFTSREVENPPRMAAMATAHPVDEQKR